NTSIARDARIDGNSVAVASDSEVEGSVGKDAYAAAITVNVLPTARIGGKFVARVSQAQRVHVDPGAMIAGTTDIRGMRPAPSRYSTLSFYVWQVIWMSAAFLAGLVLFRLVPALSRVSLETSHDLLLSAGVGFLTIVAPPIAALLAIITLVGLPLGLFTLALWIAAGYFAKIVIAGFLGRSLMEKSGDTQPAIALVLLAGL